MPGDVIRAFGEFVVRGNYVVGAVVFLILTIIQFVVIAKGAERVAEVGARFVLDAMPGKQMAIDAELRAGAIDGTEAARDARALLERESQFYGAMDGAMKFVKGDAIAGIVITRDQHRRRRSPSVSARSEHAASRESLQTLRPAHDRRRAGLADPVARHLDRRRARSSRAWPPHMHSHSVVTSRRSSSAKLACLRSRRYSSRCSRSSRACRLCRFWCLRC